MFVFVDMEWMSVGSEDHSPSQIAAMRVNERWETVDTFSSFIHPKSTQFYRWKHMSYTGGKSKDFLRAPLAEVVFARFAAWLKEEDVLLWWYEQPAQLFFELTANTVMDKYRSQTIVLCPHVIQHLGRSPESGGNPYKLASSLGIVVPQTPHHSQSDVTVLRDIMATIAFPHTSLPEPSEVLLAKPEKPTKAKKHRISKSNLVAMERSYVADITLRILHKKGCSAIDAEHELRGYENWNLIFRRKFTQCDCCKEDYAQARREYNAKLLAISAGTYFYSPESPFYHAKSCEALLDFQKFTGTKNRSEACQNGRTACPLCKEALFGKTASVADKPKPRVLTKDEMKAVKRQKVAAQVRAEKLADDTLTDTEREDVYTLTQPRYAFWATKGCMTFHLSHCGKLKSRSGLIGFSTYHDAIAAGYAPCRQCKPSKKQDMLLSIPITNTVRTDETVEDLRKLAAEAGYAFAMYPNTVMISTPVGKWRIHFRTLPIQLDHINLCYEGGEEQDFHRQPRLFLSLSDVFYYIKRHDDTLIQKGLPSAT